jgi:hypothetical protein
MQKQITYSGIGSREAPSDILLKFTEAGKYFAEKGYILRSGGADGIDTAIERGCNIGNGQKEIFLPWQGFHGHSSKLFGVCEKAREIGKQFHPAWHLLGHYPALLIARDSYQILGRNLDDPVDFVFCWTENGELKGGTAQGIRIANHYKIPVFNLGIKDLTFDAVYSKIALLCQFA